MLFRSDNITMAATRRKRNYQNDSGRNKVKVSSVKNGQNFITLFWGIVSYGMDILIGDFETLMLNRCYGQ